MQLTIQVTTADETYQVTTDLFTMVSWERKYKSKASNLGTDGIGMEDLAFLAYEASKQHKVVVPAVFDDFIRKVTSLEVIGEDDERPTNEAPTDEG
tara:strand:+ start:4858 stop:5145 length:288 start_codon:yes stop_codon:yes gene_type:complete